MSTIFTITVSPASMTTTPTGPFSITGVTGVSCQTLSAGLRRLSSCPAFVASGRLGSAEESGSTLRVTVLGNPVSGESIELEIRGAAGQAVTFRLVDLQGKLQHQQQIHATNSLERVSLPVSSRGGLFLLHVQTAQAHQHLKVIIR